MAFNDILAAIAGALTGGSEGFLADQQRKRQQAQQDRLAQQEHDQAQARQQAFDRQRLNDEQSDVSTMLQTLGPNATLAPDQAERVNRAQLGYRVQAAPDEDLSHSLFTGVTPFGAVNVPSPRFSVAPTAAEQQAAQAKADEQKRETDLANGIADPNERRAYLANPKGYKFSAQSFMDAAAKKAAADQEAADALARDVTKKKTLAPIDTEQAVDQATKTAKATLPLKLQQTESEERIRAKYKVPIPTLGADGKPATNPTAQAIANYQIAPPSPRSLATPAGEALMAQVIALNPDYDATQFPTRQATRKAFTSGKQSQTINSLNTAILHLDHLGAVAEAMGNGSFQPGNALYNATAAMFGESAPTNFAGAKDIMAGELAGALKNSGATDAEIQKVSKSLDSKQSPQQIKSYLEDVAIPMLADKAKSLDRQYHQVMGEKDPFTVYTPEAKGVLDKRNKKTAGGSAAAPAGAPQVGEERMINGQRAVWDGQGWIAK